MLSYKRSRLDAEIAKCDLVCREHHEARTALRKSAAKKEEAP